MSPRGRSPSVEKPTGTRRRRPEWVEAAEADLRRFRKWRRDHARFEAEQNDPTRYVIEWSTHGDPLYYCVSSDGFTTGLRSGTLFRRRPVAKAVAAIVGSKLRVRKCFLHPHAHPALRVQLAGPRAKPPSVKTERPDGLPPPVPLPVPPPPAGARRDLSLLPRLPERVYVIMGDSFRATPDPPYVTDPRHYGLPIFKEPVSDRQYDRYYRERIKAFLDREDAVKFAYSCNLMTVRCPVFDRASAGWVLNEGETGALAEDLT